MLSEGCHTKNRKRSSKQHIKYFNFRSKIQLDNPVKRGETAAHDVARNLIGSLTIYHLISAEHELPWCPDVDVLVTGYLRKLLHVNSTPPEEACTQLEVQESWNLGNKLLKDPVLSKLRDSFLLLEYSAQLNGEYKVAWTRLQGSQGCDSRLFAVWGYFWAIFFASITSFQGLLSRSYIYPFQESLRGHFLAIF